MHTGTPVMAAADDGPAFGWVIALDARAGTVDVVMSWLDRGPEVVCWDRGDVREATREEIRAEMAQRPEAFAECARIAIEEAARG